LTTLLAWDSSGGWGGDDVGLEVMALRRLLAQTMVGTKRAPPGT